MAKTKEKGKVIPFQQGSAFFLKRGAKEMDRNDLVSAAFQYRRAYDADPENAETALAIAEILSQMQRFEESNRILLVQMTAAKPLPETYFGLACNYFGMREFDRAIESLESYLQLEPDGFFAADAEDFLDMLDDDEEMRAATGLFSDEDYDTDAACIHARHLIDAGQLREAIDLLETNLLEYPGSAKTMNQLALACFCNNERERALTVTEKVLKKDPKDPQALCNRALFLHVRGSEQEARETLDVLSALPDPPPEILHSIAVLQLEFEQYEAALGTLTRLSLLMPYDENVLHKTGYCRYMLGNAAGAQACYRKLLRINPDDTVAKYYLAASKRSDAKRAGLHARWSIPYQVPFSEAFRRLNQINKLLSGEKEQVAELWRSDRSFRALMRWAIGLPEQRAKQSMLQLIYSFGDIHAERILRDFLLHTDQPDELKRLAFGMLKRMGVKEPYMAYLNGQWIMGRVSMVELPNGKLPQSYEQVMRHLLELMVGSRDEDCVSCAVKRFHDLAGRDDGSLPRISRQQEVSFAAAFEYLGCADAGKPVSEQEVCKKYRITKTRLHNALAKIGQEAH